jgi:hypothetical protein
MTTLEATKRLLPSATAFLAQKHGVTRTEILQALMAGDARIAEQLATLMSAAIEAHFAQSAA